ncbi:TIGR03086 family metal-binding protein [Stackebrandtia soli]|uniref:TIGR03086 family metal-binding protein n=1 Tax=Stackebrandtia soli TaxID=1892856 RepID=UPI0039E965DC
MDLVTAFHRSLDGFTTRVAQVEESQWGAPTPCEEWDVRTLVNHVVSETLWVSPLLSGATIAEVGDRFDGDQLGDDPAASARSAASAASSAADEAGVLDRTTHLSFGDTPSEEYLNQITADLAIHSWDLAVATGEDPVLDPEVVDKVGDWFQEREQLYRDSGAIGPRAPVPSDAGRQDRLLGAFGRNPDWSPDV